MQTLVDFAFDLVAWISSLLKAWAFVLVADRPDAGAGLICATCLLIIIAAYDAMVLRRPALRCIATVIAPLLVLHVVVFIAMQAGARRITLDSDKIKPLEGGLLHAISLNEKNAALLADSKWWLVRDDGLFSLPRWLLADTRYSREASAARAGQGPGRYLVKGRRFYLSGFDDAGGSAQTGRLVIVAEPAWLGIFRVGLALLYSGGVLVFAVARTGRRMAGCLVRLLRAPLFLVPACCFALFFGAHEGRFINQDARMQMVTSRDDDGYMIERLQQVAELGTMDPWQASNNAYGAIGYYPFAALPFAAAQFGAETPLAALNLWVRGLKLLISLAMLAAVWALGARHLGRWPAFAAVVLLSLNMGFLAYSSFPFYPDILMACFAALSLGFMLDLADGWRANSFFLSLLCAAFSVSVKFLTVLLFPFIFILAAAALWRVHHGDARTFLARLLGYGTIGGVMCAAVFFICNPYPDYNIEWITPNYKLVSTLYDASSPNVVAGEAASIAAWKSQAYAFGDDHLDAMALLVALLALAVIAARWRRDRALALKAGILLAFVLLLQFYLLKSITLTTSIDQRLVLPLLPGVYLVAVWGVVAVLESGWLQQRARLMLAGAGVVALAVALWPRLKQTGEFWESFGRPPASSAVGDWLRAAAVPPEADIVTGLQSYFPAEYRHVIDGHWDPATVKWHLLQSASPPLVYIEDNLYYDMYFGDAAKARGVSSEAQQLLQQAGREFYNGLRGNHQPPYVLVHSGTEVVGTNSLRPMTTGFHIYADPYAFSANLIATAKRSENTGAFEWPAPVSAGVIHLSLKGQDQPAIHARLQKADGSAETLLIPPTAKADAAVTERHLRLVPARDITGLTLELAGGAPAAPSLVEDIRVHASYPLGLNPTRHYFDISAAHADLIASRPHSHAGIKLSAGATQNISLTSSAGREVSGACLVVDDLPRGVVTARFMIEFADGSKTVIAGVETRGTGPGCVSLAVTIPAGKKVRRIDCTVSATSDAILRQFVADAWSGDWAEAE